jgi:succinoglycan biosynthesis transport protein ExoP
MDLILLYKALMRRKWYLIIIPFLSAICAVVLTSDYKRMFKSSAQLSTGFTVSEQVSVTEERFNIFQADIKFNNLIETITSPKVFGLLSYHLLLHDLDEGKVPYRTVTNQEELTRIYSAISKEEIVTLLTHKIDSLQVINAYHDRERKIIDLLKLYKYDYRSLRESIHVFRVEGTDYLQLVSHTERPTLSADVTNILCEQFLRYYTFLQADKSGESVQNFLKLVQQKDKELGIAEEALRLFKTENGIINLEASSESKIGQITDLENLKEVENQNIRAIRLELDQVNRELTKNAKGNSTNNSEVLEIRNKINELNEKYVQSGSSGQLYQDSINFYRNLLLKTIDYGSNSDVVSKKEDLETRYDIAKQNLTSINRRLGSLNRNIGIDANIQARLSNLEREVNRASDEYLAAQEKYNTALDVASVNQGSVRQVLYGQPATEPEPSKRIIITALSGAASFVFCLIIIIFLEYIDISIKNPYNFQRMFNEVRLLGTLNKIKLRKSGMGHLFDPAEKPQKHEQVFKEMVRKMRFEIQNSERSVFLITSNKIGEGKSMFMEVLARGLSATQKRVLLIDANFTNNTLSRDFEGSDALEAVGKGDRKIEEEGTVVGTSIKNVDLLGCVGGEYSPSEIFDFEKFRSALQTIRSAYDYVLIESSALNYYTDTKELAQFVDGIITVFSAESVVKESDKTSMEYLQTLDDRFMGAILNKVKLENINQ